MVFFDIIQSYIIKGVIILVILQSMLLLQNLLYQHTEKAVLEEELSTASFTFSSEMRQIGYNSSVTPFTIAETSRVEILGDIDNNGTANVVRYYLAPMPSSTKFYLERTINGGAPITAGRNFRKFYLTYYDSVGNTIHVPASLVNLAKIKSISVLAIMENDEQFYGDYLRSSWQAQIFPPNINK
jgi:hypothetical protein